MLKISKCIITIIFCLLLFGLEVNALGEKVNYSTDIDQPTQGASCCINITGNVNYDANDDVNLADLLYLVNYMFASPPGPEPVCMEEADVNLSFQVNLADLLYLVDYMFASPSGPPPEPCP